MRPLLPLILLFQSALLTAQPTDYYRFPLNIPIYLSANFGEIRTNRFHTGIDIKTEGVVGKPLYAAADGYIARVTVAPTGYGRALYIAHPNGTTTVYAHMDRFTSAIENFLKSERYRLKRSDLDAFPDVGRFTVKKGDPIGFAGNSGSSTGPHLHFEVRQTSTGKTLNVPARGWIKTAEADMIPPRIMRLYHIDIDTIAGVPIHSRPRAHDVKQSLDGSWSLVRSEPLKAGPTSYFVIETTDRRGDVTNTFGVRRVRMSVDGDERVVFEKDGLLFDEVRYACVSVLYDIQRTSRNEVIMLATKSGNRLPMYKKAIGRGTIRFSGESGNSSVNSNSNSGGNSHNSSKIAEGIDGSNSNARTSESTSENTSGSTSKIAPGAASKTTSKTTTKTITITVEDDAGNTSFLNFSVIPDPAHTPPSRPAGRIATDRSDFIYLSDGLAVSIPKGALYEPVFYTQSVVELPVKPRADSIRPLTPLLRTGDGIRPLHSAMKLGISAPEIPENQRHHACLARVADNGTLSYAGGAWSNGSVNGTSRDFGTFCVVVDATPPTVRASFADAADLTRTESITITSTDNFSGISSFSGTIDGEWIIFERSASHGRFTHRFDLERLQVGRTHTLEFTTRDGAGNRTVWRGTFFK